MQVFLAILVLISLALLTSSPRFYRLRRSRVGTSLFSDGWLAVGVGAMLGPSGFGLVQTESVLSATPLIVVGLGWIGVMVGLQARRRLLGSLPASVWRVFFADAALSVLVFGVGAWLALGWWTASDEVGVLVLPACALMACAVGWSMETRSLRAVDTPETARLALLVRAGGGLGAILAIGLMGVGSTLYAPTTVGGDAPGALTVATRSVVALLLALGLGVLGRDAIRLAGRNRPELLVVFLGLVALAAGVAADLAISPLFAAMLTGVVIANLATGDTLPFERFILKAEHTVAVLFALLAGVLLDPAIGAKGLALAFAVGAARLVCKPVVFRASARAGNDDDARALPARSPLYTGPARQAPLAVAIGVAFVLAEPSDFSRRLLAVIVVGGIVSALLPVTIGAITPNGLRRLEGAPTGEGGRA